MSSPLEYLELPAEKNPSGCVIALHGRGVTGEDLMPLAEMLDLPEFRFIFPHAPFPMEFGGYAWYPLPPGDRDGILQSRALLLNLIGRIEKETPANRIALMGFSQGAVMSLETALRYPRRLAGVAALSGYLYDSTCFAKQKENLSGFPIFIAHGTADDVLPVAGSLKAAKLLQEAGLQVTFKEYPIAHEIIPDEINDLRLFLQGCLPAA